MNHKMMLSAVVAMSAFATFAASSVSDVVVRQRWPWSETVDIDYTLTGDKGDVTFTATWDGQATPVIIGTDFQVEAGQHRYEWCPTNNYAGQTLTGFTVTAEAGSTADHKYLILDLVNGGYSFLATPPAGGWTDEYKSTKMVFARCPAGTYQNGMSYNRTRYVGEMTYVATGKQERDDTQFSYLYAQAAQVCTVQFTSDWYFSIFPMTVAQYEQLENGNATSDYTRKTISYNKLRGRLDDTPAINWPSTKYEVSTNSFVKKLREKAGGVLCIDLPQENQCETALRGGASTYWWNGGSIEDTLEQMTNYVNQSVNWYYSNGGIATLQPVGTMAPNNWGIYDLAGGNFCLDTANRVADRGYPSSGCAGGTDPVGASLTPENVSPYNIKRLVHGSGGYSDKAKLYELLPAYRNMYEQGITMAARFAIHLKPLNFGD